MNEFILQIYNDEYIFQLTIHTLKFKNMEIYKNCILSVHWDLVIDKETSKFINKYKT